MSTESDAKTFRFVGKDGYESPKALDISLAEDHESDIILAYEMNGSPLGDDGPIRSVINRDVIPDEANSQYAVSNLEYVIID